MLDSVDMILWVGESVVMWFPEDNVWYNWTGEGLGFDVEWAEESQK